MGGIVFDFERISGEIATRYISHTGGHRRGRLPERPIVQVSKVPAVLRRLHAIDARRLQERRSWVVSFSILSAFRARSRLVITQAVDRAGQHRGVD